MKMKLVPIGKFIIFQMLLGWTYGENTKCMSRMFDYFVEETEAHWSISTSHFKCVSKCNAKPKRIEPNSTFILERVFALERRKVNCLSANIERGVQQSMEDTYERIPLIHFEDLPLFYYNPDLKKSKFEAEKLCAKMKLNFGIDPSLVEPFLKLTQRKTDSTDRVVLWSQEMSKGRISMECNANWILDKMLMKQTLDCKERINFVCTLPWWCHKEACASRCTPNGPDECRSPTRSTIKSECYPACVSTTCLDEVDERYGFKSGDGEMIDLCDKTIYISNVQVGHKFSQTYCCGKAMRPLALETLNVQNCFKNKIFGLASSNLSNVSFWTSGSSDKCPNSFGWCGGSVKEFINFELLGMDSLKSAVGKECVSVTFGKSANTTDAILRTEDCTLKKRVICELSYYKTQKFMCANGRALISFQTKEKHDCVEATLLANKVPNGTYWVSAESIGCPSVIRWCDKITNPVVDVKSSYLNWKKGEPSPDPLKECTVVDFQYTKPHLRFSRTECSTAYSSIAEEVDPKYKMN